MTSVSSQAVPYFPGPIVEGADEIEDLICCTCNSAPYADITSTLGTGGGVRTRTSSTPHLHPSDHRTKAITSPTSPWDWVLMYNREKKKRPKKLHWET